MDKHQQLATYIAGNPKAVSDVVDIDRQYDRLLHFNFTATNTSLDADTVADTRAFARWVENELQNRQCRYGIGGYMEHRTLYARSALFDTPGQEPRRLHLGTDIWGPALTPVYAPLSGRIHSFQNNDLFGDYGPTIILEHDLDGLALYSLYGHLSAQSLEGLVVGQAIRQGQQIAAFGHMDENGSWPPHLHFQLMFDIQGSAGDYPGVCRYAEKELYRQNIPDPEIILRLNTATIR